MQLHYQRGSIYRSKIARFIKIFGESLWQINNNYGLRWNIEIYFSGIKRLFGETIRAVKPEYIIQEMMLKFYFYDEFNRFKEACK